MSVHDAEPGDIYVDAWDTLWEVVSIIREPSVQVRRVGSEIDHRSGGVSGLMWQGFKRIHRPRASGIVTEGGDAPAAPGAERVEPGGVAETHASIVLTQGGSNDRG